VKSDHAAAELPARTRALLDYAQKLAAEPWNVGADDIEGLRAQGFSDRDITDAVHNVAFFAYITRVAQGLGVELEPFMHKGGENVAPGAPLDG